MTSAEASDPTRPISDRPIDRLVAEFLATDVRRESARRHGARRPGYDDRLPDLLDPAVSRRNVADEQRLRALESLADRELTDQECIRNWAAHRRPSGGLDGTLVGRQGRFCGNRASWPWCRCSWT